MLLFVPFFVGLRFNLEDEGYIYLRNICSPSTEYTELNTRQYKKKKKLHGPTERPPLLGEVVANFCG
jgi:hypothetical protein